MDQQNKTKQSFQEEEMLLIKKDFIRSLVVNLLFLVALVGLYFLNRSFHFLDSLLNRF